VETARKRVVKPAEERRRDILEAALRLFGERGFHETTVQDIATAAGVATGSVYIHFPSKDHLIVALHKRFYEGLTETVSDVVTEALERMASGKTITTRDAVDAMMDATAAFSVANGDLCHMAAKYLPHPALVGAEHDFVEFMARVLHQGNELGLASVGDPEMAAYLINNAIGGSIMSAIAYGKPDDVPRLVEAMKEFVYRAIVAPPTD
jgi:AcrR family transcriptional regulator